jgi:tetratricopeptide (TPR) repeat protein
MKKNYLRGVTTAIGLCLLVSQFSFSIQPLQAQGSSSTNCRSWVQGDLEEQLRRLESEGFDLVNRGNFTQGIKSLNQLIQVASKLANEGEKSLIVEQIIEGYNFQQSRLGQFVQRTKPEQKPQVIKFLGRLEQFTQRLRVEHSSNTANAFTSIASAYRELGQTDRAIAVLSQAIQATKSIRGTEFQTKALTAIAQEYLILQKPSEAERILDQSLRVAQQIKIFKSSSKDFVLESISSTYAKLGKIDKALQVAQTIPGQSYRSKVQLAVVQAYRI